MLVGGIAYAFRYSWIDANILSVGDYGKVRLTELTGVPEFAWWALLALGAAACFTWLERSASSVGSSGHQS